MIRKKLSWQNNPEGKLTNAQEVDLEHRISMYEKGKLSFTSWKEVRKAIEDKGKEAGGCIN